ncbi:MAG: TldD/PmbA family protein [Candidatus Heimdallarchaeota archaeon]
MKIVDELKVFDDSLIKRLSNLATNKINYWDLRASLQNGTTLDFTNQKSKEISSYETLECGIRTFLDGGWGFCVLKELNRENIINSFSKAIKLAKQSHLFCKTNFKMTESKPIQKHFIINSKRNLESIDIKDKIEIVKYHEDIASTYSKKIKNSHTIYLDGYSKHLFLNSFGSKIYQDFEMVRIFSAVYAQKESIIQTAMNSVGGVGGFEILETEEAQKISLKSAKQAVKLLDAKSPVGGKFNVIMDSKLTGTFIHEAFGHACEADLVLNKESILEDKIGKIVAIDDVNVIDDPTIGKAKMFNLPYELYGSYFVDDEGIPSQKTVIIENGVLRNFLHNIETASRMSVLPNGHGRANSCTATPQVRMGFTYLEPKDWELDEMIEDTKSGILCEDFQYGYTDATTGNFQFKCKFSYKIENGEKKELMRDVSLSGMTLDVLKKINSIGNKNTFNYSDGMCGKGGQGIRVCDGGPYIRIEAVIVGGLN